MRRAAASLLALLILAFVCSASSAPKAYAAVPDDDVPGSLLPASPIVGTLTDASDRNDVYALYLEAGQTVSVLVTDDVGGDCRAQLWAPGTSTVQSWDQPYTFGDGNTSPGAFSVTAAVSGVYYLDVFALIGYQPSCNYTVLYSISESHLRGTVSDSIGPVEGVTATAWQWEAEGEGFWFPAGSAQTDVNGHFDVANLPAGTYRLAFDDQTGMRLASFLGGTDLDTAEDVVLADGGSVTGLDASMHLGGRIAGTLRDADGPIEGAIVMAHEWSEVERDWVPFSQASTGADGTYEMGPQLPGAYCIEFSDPAGNHLTQWYSDAADSLAATSVSVDAGRVTDGVDAVLLKAGKIAGRVTHADLPLPGISVEILTWNASDAAWTTQEVVSTDESGAYEFTALSEGAYRVGSSDESGVYLSQYFGGAASASESTNVEVTAGATASGIDMHLAPASRLAGTVTGPDGGIPGVTTILYLLNGASGQWEPVATGVTDDFGGYVVGSLSAGTYRLGFQDPSGAYIDTFYGDQRSLELSSDVVAAEGTTESGLDVVMSRAGQISGAVTSGGNPLANVSVTAFALDENGDVAGCMGATTDAGGNYSIGGLPTGSYQVAFDDPSGEHVTTFYGGSWDYRLEVSEGEALEGISADLGRAGHILGNVRDSNGAPLGKVSVTAHPIDPEDGLTGEATEAGFSVLTDEDGSYDIGRLAPGQYLVSFSDGEAGDIVDEYFGDSRTVEAAQPVVVVAGNKTSDVNATCDWAGHVSGVVSGNSGSFDGIEATAYGWNAVDSSWDPVRSSTADASGLYAITDLPAGVYRVGFSDSSGTYVNAFYGGAFEVETALSIPVSAGLSVSGVNIALAKAGHIKGWVTGVGGYLGNVWVKAERRVGSSSWALDGEFITDTDGTYDIGGLRAGEYRIRFVDLNGVHGACYYGGATSPEAATGIILSPAETRAALGGFMVRDTSAPVTAVGGAESGWVNHPVTLRLTYTDDSALASGQWTRYRIGDGPFLYVAMDDVVLPEGVTGIPDVSEWVTPEIKVATEGTTGIYFQSKDTVGNEETLRSVVVRIDKTAPLTTDDHASRYVDSATFRLVPEDSGSGVAATQWRVDGGTWRSGTSVVVSELGSHVVSYRSVDVAGNQEVVRQATFDVLSPSSITLSSASRHSVDYGSSSQVAGLLKGGGVGLSGQTVILQAAQPGAAFTDAGQQATTGRDGGFSFSVKPQSKTYYRVRFAGAGHFAASNPSEPIYVLPKSYVRTPIARSTMSRTKYYTVYGYLKPGHATGTKPVQIRCYKKNSSGVYKYHHTVYAKVSDYSSYSKYKAAVKLHHKGRWRLRAYASADSGHAATWSSSYDYVTVK